jgi:hypothetical protein
MIVGDLGLLALRACDLRQRATLYRRGGLYSRALSLPPGRTGLHRGIACRSLGLEARARCGDPARYRCSSVPEPPDGGPYGVRPGRPAQPAELIGGSWLSQSPRAVDSTVVAQTHKEDSDEAIHDRRSRAACSGRRRCGVLRCSAQQRRGARHAPREGGALGAHRPHQPRLPSQPEPLARRRRRVDAQEQRLRGLQDGHR